METFNEKAWIGASFYFVDCTFFYSTCNTSQLNEGRSSVVTEEDLKHLWQLVEMRDGGPGWIHMMDRSAPNMSYQAWRRDPKVGYFLFHLFDSGVNFFFNF